MGRGGLYVSDGLLYVGHVIGLQRGQQAIDRGENIIRRIAAIRIAVVEDWLGGQSRGEGDAVGIVDLPWSTGLAELVDAVAVGQVDAVGWLRILVAAENVVAAHR